MPRNVRNFWLDVSVDGRRSAVETGPRSADGGFELTVRMREDGDVGPVTLTVRGTANPDGTLALTAWTPDGREIAIEGKR